VLVAVTEKSLVVQHNKIVEAKYKLSVGEQRLVKLLVSMIEKNDADFKVYQISIKHLSDLLGLSDNDFYRKVKEISKKLISNVLVFKDASGRELQVSWLSSAEYIEKMGIVELEFSPKLKPFLLHLKNHFTAYELGNVINLKHTYSIRIYELLKQYERIGKRRFLVEDLRNLLMVGKDEYVRYRDFKRWVLQVAQKELSEKTDIAFDWKEEKVRRVCVALEFIITPQKRPRNNKEKQGGKNTTVVEGKKVKAQDAVLEGDKPQPLKEVQPTPVDENFSRLVALGVHAATAEELVKEYGGEEIKVAVDYAERLHREKGLSNFAGFVVQAIRKGFKDGEAEKRQRAEEDAKRKWENEERRKGWEHLKATYQQAKKAAFDVWYASIPEDEVRELRQEYIKTLSPMVNNKKTFVEKMFIGYLLGYFAFPSLREWVQQNQVDVSEFEEELRREQVQAAA
jgi:plasmid replication initiation protein